MQRVRKALRYVAKELGVARPLVDARFETDGVALFVARADRLLDVSAEGQVALRQVLDASLERIEWSAGSRHGCTLRFVRAGFSVSRGPSSSIRGAASVNRPSPGPESKRA
jgi:hypothetical protein